jgi:DNA-binding NarL/FixJ family response regulator
MTRSIRVLVVDDHALVRGALAERIQREPDIHVVGTAANADEAIRQALETNPDLILMDIDMPGLICFDAAREIATLCPDTRVVFLSAFLHDWYIDQALQVRARGYLTKREPPETVVAAIREVASGGAYFSEEVRSRIVVDSGGARLGDDSKSVATTMTTREVEVLRYIARGLSKKEIATIMHISPKTVDKHSTNLMTKLNIHDRVALARYAIREGLAEA